MRDTKMTTKRTNSPEDIRQTFMVLVVSTCLVIFAASCSQIAPADTSANATPNSQPANPEADKAAVRKLLDDHGDAMVRVDTATLDRLWADEIVLIDHEGNTLTKTQWLDLLTSGTEKIEPADASSNSTDVRIYGNTAVAVLKVTQKATLEGKPHDGRMTISTVLVKGDRGWQLVLAQLSELKPISESR
jgi:ketosteroid isomerase-like protein